MKKGILYLLITLTAVSCSTTSRLAEGEVLYTGVRRTVVESADGSRVPSAVESAVKEPLNVRPNNPLFSPYIRTPFPVGLWAYNHLYSPSRTEQGENQSWLYRQLAREPVLVSTVNPDLRMKLVQDILDNLGYFRSSATYEILPRSNPRRARIGYHITVAEPWFYSRVTFPEVCCPVTERIAEMQDASLLRPGEQFNIDTLSAERIRITNLLRNDSYYYFRPDYLEYLADTLQQRFRVDLRMITTEGIPPAAMLPYRIGQVEVEFTNPKGGEPDSLVYNGITIHYEKPLKLRPKILAAALTLRPGEASRVDDIDRTLTNLNKLGVFRFVNLSVTPLDSLRGADSLNMLITGAFDMPLDAELGVDFASKSNSFIGPGAQFTLRNKNFLRGGELFSIKFNAAYEWQTGNTESQLHTSLINSYELGVSASLAVPRMVAPRFVPRSKRYDDRTTFQIGTSVMNRPDFFTMLSANASVSYDFQSSPYSFHNLTPLRLTYNNLLRTTAEMDSLLDGNRALRQSFENQFIPALSYTYTFDRPVGRGRRDRIMWQTMVMESGNIVSGVQGLFGVERPRNLFGSRFSEFVKGTTELRYFKALGEKSMLAFRLMTGAGHAYGNFSELPFSEQFYIGGANSIRAFTIRSVGPGSFRPDPDETFGYFDQTGNFKLEGNVEYRFNLINRLNGAVFLDAGNIWLLERDPDRPGAKLGEGRFLNDIALGTGLGLRYDITFLVIRADLGIALHTPYDTGRSGYYNISRFRDGIGLHLAIGYPF